MENSKINEKEIIFGKGIGQVIHDIRNPLNTIIGFSSIIKIDDKISDELRNYINKIFQSGLAIEKLLSNIDHYLMEEIKSDHSDFIAQDAIKNYFNTINDFIKENQISIEYISDKSIEINFSLEILNKIIDNLFLFSYKGLRTIDTREIKIYFKNDKDKLIIYYTDSSTPVFIEKEYFTFNEILKSRRGLGPLFVEKYINSCGGSIKYFYGKKWLSIISNVTQSTTYNHGYIIEIPAIHKVC